MKKNISITLDDTLIEDVEKMMGPEHHDRPSVSNMIAHLIKTHPAHMAFKMGEKRKEKLSGKK